MSGSGTSMRLVPVRVLMALICTLAVFAGAAETPAGVIQDSAQRLVNRWRSRSTGRWDRAGNPQCLAQVTESFPSEMYQGYYTGGGAAFSGTRATLCRGENRFCDEGTFGVDYVSPLSRVRLHWFHGRKFQAGEGQYEADRRNNPFANLAGFGRFRSTDKH